VSKKTISKRQAMKIANKMAEPWQTYQYVGKPKLKKVKDGYAYAFATTSKKTGKPVGFEVGHADAHGAGGVNVSAAQASLIRQLKYPKVKKARGKRNNG